MLRFVVEQSYDVQKLNVVTSTLWFSPGIETKTLLMKEKR